MQQPELTRVTRSKSFSKLNNSSAIRNILRSRKFLSFKHSVFFKRDTQATPTFQITSFYCVFFFRFHTTAYIGHSLLVKLLLSLDNLLVVLIWSCRLFCTEDNMSSNSRSKSSGELRASERFVMEKNSKPLQTHCEEQGECRKLLWLWEKGVKLELLRHCETYLMK